MRDEQRKREVDAARKRAVRRQRAADGLCARCGERRPVPGGSACGACRERQTAGQRERRAYLKRIGRCRDCGQRRCAVGLSACPECLEQRAARQRRYSTAGRSRCAARVRFLDGGMETGWRQCQGLAAPGETCCWKHGGRRLTEAEREEAKSLGRTK